MAGKKTMLAELKVSPKSQLNKASSNWLKSNKDLDKLFSEAIEYQRELELDDKKWNEKKLSQALENLVLYELKYIASGVALALKAKEKSPEKEDSIVSKDMPALLKDARKLIKKKCKAALEELETSGGGDDKKAVKQGLDVFREVSSLSLKALFSQPVEDTLAVFAALQKDIKKAEEDDKLADAEKNDKKKNAYQMAAEKRRNGAFDRSSRSMSRIVDAYAKAREQVGSAIDALEKYADSLKKSETDELKAFATHVSKKTPAIKKLDRELNDFRTALARAAEDIKSRKDDSDNIARKSANFATSVKASEKTADKARDEFLDLAAQFKRIESNSKK